MEVTTLAGLAILMIGDSHFAYQGGLATTLQDLLVQQGAKVTTYAACGAPASVWANSGVASCGSAKRVQAGPLQSNHELSASVPSVSQLIATYHPGLVIVGLGDTMGDYANAVFSPSYINSEVNALTSRIRTSSVPCVWIGPGWGTEGGPYFKTYARLQQVNDYLASHVAPCTYVDSTRFAAPGEWPTFDGLHYTLPGYQKWAFAIDRVLTQQVRKSPEAASTGNLIAAMTIR